MFLKCFGDNKSSSDRGYPTVIQELCRQFSWADIKKATNNFDRKRIIGDGEFSKAYKGYLKRNDGTNYAVAVKRFKVKRPDGWGEFMNEVELHCQFHHPHIISLIGFCIHKKEKIIVFEYMPNGSLRGHLLGGELSWKKRIEICIGAARGLHYLHAGAKRTIIHRHIKPSYILLDHNMHPKLVGFGLSIQGARFMSKPKPIKITTPGYIRGNWEYLAKELLMDRTASDRCDVYSFGMVLLEVVWAKTIFDMESRGNFLKKPVEEYIDPNIKGKIAPECWQVFIDIIAGCLKNEPDERPAMGEVEVQLEHALSLQEQADITNTDAHYILLSKTIINREREDITETTNSCGSLEDNETGDMFRT